MKNFVFWIGRPYNIQKFTDVSEQRTAAIFRVEKEAIEARIIQQHADSKFLMLVCELLSDNTASFPRRSALRTWKPTSSNTI
jgi:hypothetical protein